MRKTTGMCCVWRPGSISRRHSVVYEALQRLPNAARHLDIACCAFRRDMVERALKWSRESCTTVPVAARCYISWPVSITASPVQRPDVAEHRFFSTSCSTPIHLHMQEGSDLYGQAIYAPLPLRNLPDSSCREWGDVASMYALVASRSCASMRVRRGSHPPPCACGGYGS
jgi:hypothetical protein